MPDNAYLSVAEAATELAMTVWEVVALTDSGRIQSVTLIDANSLRAYQQEHA